MEIFPESWINLNLILLNFTQNGLKEAPKSWQALCSIFGSLPWSQKQIKNSETQNVLMLNLLSWSLIFYT